jgi:hypothetical protein
MIKYILLISSIASLQSIAQDLTISKKIQQAMDKIDTNILRSHIAYLADDRLKGRLPGTEGYQMAVDYVVDQYKKLGLKPGGDDQGFTHEGDLFGVTVN